ncbi:hypothetical protein [Eisenibacter elegans]|uniref:hypothetical protein n=1 Tax=Eisenibacter elegans TaxID=997 RepID=UPI00040E2842|nr:hypothetical protein [Eisenibacter elegans]
MQKIFENPYAELYNLSPELPQVMFGYWKGFWELSDAEAMRALTFPFDYIAKHQIKVMITDYRYLDVVPIETNQWLEDVWFPKVSDLGLVAELVLDAEDLTGQISVDFMYENVQQTTGLYTQKVDTLEHAKELAKDFLARLKS